MQLLQAVETVFQSPPISYEPAKHSLKAWATYCLRERGYKVIYAQEADFAIEGKQGEKAYFKVAQTPPDSPSSKFSWLILDPITQQVTLLPTTSD
jgi:hypothetical protein